MQFTAAMRLLFVGNSFTGRNSLPELVRHLAATASPARELQYEGVLANGASLRQHWNKGVAAELLSRGGWDYLVLQEQSTLPIKNPVRYHENARLFLEAAAAAQVPVALYLTWARAHAPETQSQLNQATESLAAESGAHIVPVGPLWAQLLQERPELELHDKDGSHPSPLGSALAACVFVRSLWSAAVDPGRPPQELKVSGEEFAAVAEFVNAQLPALAG